MKLHVPGLEIVPSGPITAGSTPVWPDGWSPTWRCSRCGAERHFPGPVPARAAIPCGACGARAATGPGAPVQVDTDT